MTDTIFPSGVDPSLIQDANYRFDADDRQYIDKQIRAIEQYVLGISVIGGGGLVANVLDVSATGTINDLVGTSGGSPVTMYRFTGAGDVNLTGIASPTDGRQVILYAKDPTHHLTLKAETITSTAANRFEGSDVVVPNKGGALIAYDAENARWYLVGILSSTTIAGTTNGVVSMSAPNTGVADDSFSIPATGQMAVGYDGDGVKGQLYVYCATAGTETYASAVAAGTLPDGGLIRVSYYLADGPGHGDSVTIVGYQASTDNTPNGVQSASRAALYISGGVPNFGDGTTQVNLNGDGVLINAGPGGGGGGSFPLTDHTGEVWFQCQSLDAPASGFSKGHLRLIDYGSAGILTMGASGYVYAALGSANQVLVVNGTGNGLVWVDQSSLTGAVGGSTTQFLWNNAGAEAGASGLLYDSTNNRPRMPNGLALRASTFDQVLSCTPTANRTWTIPDASDTALGAATAATVTNKTILGSQGASQTLSALNVDWSTANVFQKTLANSAQAITFSNTADGQTIILKLTGGGASCTVSWPAGTKWAGGSAPTQTTSGTDIYTFINIGGTIYGSVVQAMA